MDRYSPGARETNPENRGPASSPSDSSSATETDMTNTEIKLWSASILTAVVWVGVYGWAAHAFLSYVTR